MVTLLAGLKAKRGKGKELVDLCLEMAGEVREKEPGCLRYDPYVSPEDPDEVIFVEKYNSKDDLEEHRKTDHYQKIVKEKIGAILAEKPEIEVYET
ncbi:MAG: putative quinol monooxygenase [Bacillota bacterium]